MRTLALLSTASAALAANSWSVIAPNVCTEATGIAGNADGKTVFMAGGQNGGGSFVFKSVDGGKTWATTHDAFEMLYLDITSFGDNVLAASIFGDEFSVDGGNNFNYSANGALQAQCVRNLGPHDTPLGFAAVGSVGNLTSEMNGVAISTDAGKTFTSIPLPLLQTDARYGAFPSDQVWYISAGQWPGGSGSSDQPTTGGSKPGSEGVRAISQKLSLERDPATKAVRHLWGSASAATGERVVSGRGLQAPSNTSYAAQLIKTEDGGKTWKSLFYKLNWAYFNGIDCIDEQQCCVAAEADDGPSAGSYIMCTWDGGNNWNQTYSSTYAGASLLDLRVIDGNRYWAVGGIIQSLPEAAAFLLSEDAGRTWTVDSVLQSAYATSVDCAVQTTDCWATVVDATQTASVAYANQL